ncbi:capsular polysaccharide transport system ATP-binding protein [Cognatiyoonia koreensis]|uniref:Capsular polysaccharide transport system ATP-binding protein n=1 Tax=Cognatiyoonia koreensis TaxID=364200 RepID=A0A1I0RQD5_9RHOB|nr:ATP-binding cassette domain-containing protein [Cognatiyoonia koreensis]SEW43475.1 capsular polysaccharide transport system ATP-binding protein [Cognatiyoonia koreensis]
MMTLRHVTVRRPDDSNARPILSDCDLTVGAREKIGILAMPGSGKSSLARVLSGVEAPALGSVTSTGFVSWPLGYAGFLHPNLSIIENLLLIARLTGQKPDWYVAQVTILSGLQERAWNKVQTLTPTQRAVLSFMCAMARPAGLLVADEVLSVGSPERRKVCDALVARHLSRNGLIFLSRNARQLRAHCDRFFALAHGQLIPCDTVETAQSLLAEEPAYV